MGELQEPLLKVGVRLYAGSWVAMLVGVFALVVTPESSRLLVAAALANTAGLAIGALGAILWAVTTVDRPRHRTRASASAGS